MAGRPLLCSVIEAARLLGIGRSATYLLISDGTIRSVHHGRRRLVDVASLTAWAASLPEVPETNHSLTAPSKG